jgi:hypothetical protein
MGMPSIPPSTLTAIMQNHTGQHEINHSRYSVWSVLNSFQQSGEPDSPIDPSILCYRLAAEKDDREPERALRQDDHDGGECYLALRGKGDERHDKQESIKGKGENE